MTEAENEAARRCVRRWLDRQPPEVVRELEQMARTGELAQAVAAARAAVPVYRAIRTALMPHLSEMAVMLTDAVREAAKTGLLEVPDGRSGA